VKLLAVDLPVAVGMKEYKIATIIFTPMNLPDQMVFVPACLLCNQLQADRTSAALFFPQVENLSPSLQALISLILT